MHTFSTLVLYERHGRAAIGYRAEMMDQIARGDIAEGSRGAWELRCWTPANESPRYGVTADELTALVNAVFRTTSYCVGDSRRSDAVRRFHCGHSGIVVDLPAGLPLAEHLALWGSVGRPAICRHPEVMIDGKSRNVYEQQVVHV